MRPESDAGVNASFPRHFQQRSATACFLGRVSAGYSVLGPWPGGLGPRGPWRGSGAAAARAVSSRLQPRTININLRTNSDERRVRATRTNMKPEAPTDDLDGLHSLLRDWEVARPLPAGFGDRVWRRIAQDEASTGAPWVLLTNWLADKLTRPALAIGYLTVLALAGLVAGSWQARVASEHAAATLSSRYVQMVDPYRMPPP
jgi:hypothetical protein